MSQPPSEFAVNFKRDLSIITFVLYLLSLLATPVVCILAYVARDVTALAFMPITLCLQCVAPYVAGYCERKQ
jgi:hypothetical protein